MLTSLVPFPFQPPPPPLPPPLTPAPVPCTWVHSRVEDANLHTAPVILGVLLYHAACSIGQTESRDSTHAKMDAASMSVVPAGWRQAW